ncbi:hypothetical protein CRYUN_Cryun01aG0049500 [Craigia yunnanensis]
MTYQAVLSPPGGVSQGDAANSNKYRGGNSVVNRTTFLSFYIPNSVAFVMAWAITLALFRVVAKSILSFLYPLYFLMSVCYGAAMTIIAPSIVTASVAIVAGSSVLDTAPFLLFFIPNIAALYFIPRNMFRPYLHPYLFLLDCPRHITVNVTVLPLIICSADHITKLILPQNHGSVCLYPCLFPYHDYVPYNSNMTNPKTTKKNL